MVTGTRNSVTDFANKDNYDIMLKSLIVNDDEWLLYSIVCVMQKYTKLLLISKDKPSCTIPRRSGERRRGQRGNFILARTTNLSKERNNNN